MLIVEEWIWTISSMIGSIFLLILLLLAVGDLNLRRQSNDSRAAILLAWRIVIVDATLLFVLVVGILIGIIALLHVGGQSVILGLIASNVAIMVLAGYLFWSRLAVQHAGEVEVKQLQETIAANNAQEKGTN